MLRGQVITNKLLSIYYAIKYHKLLAIIKLEYILLLSFICRIFCAFAYASSSFVPRLYSTSQTGDKLLSLMTILV